MRARATLQKSAALATTALLGACSAHRFSDVVRSLPSPDGRVVASSIVAAGPFVWNGADIGVALSPRGADPRDGSEVLLYGEDRVEPAFAWEAANDLVVRLPCGRWSNLTNHYQVPGTSRIVNIHFQPALEACGTRRDVTPSDRSIPAP